MNTQLLWRCIALGVLFWGSGVVTVRLLGDQVFTSGSLWLPLFFLLLFPITWLFLLISRGVTGLALGQLLRPVVVMTITATLLDGVALAWFSSLYHSNEVVALRGAAWILAGAGIGLLLPFLLAGSTRAAD